MGVSEDIRLAMGNPRAAIKTLSEARQRIKFYSHLHEIFFSQPYFWLWQQIRPGTTLLDIGAFIGDSAAYFVLHPNITKIVAYEPNRFAYRILKDNVNHMPKALRSKIVIRNAAIMGMKSTVSSTARDATGMNRVEEGGDVPAATLASETKGLANVAIKCDTEGSEYSIFMKVPKNIYAIQMEFHNGADPLYKALSNTGFNVIVPAKNSSLGYLCALKRPK